MKAVLFTAVAGLFASVALPGQLIIEMQEDAGNVVVSGSGTLDLTGMSYTGGALLRGSFVGPLASVNIMPAVATPVDGYTDPGFSGPGFISTGISIVTPGSHSGDSFGFARSTKGISVPVGYTSGDPLSGSMRFDGTTLADLGLNIGDSFVWTVSSGDTITLTVTEIPEPASLAFVVLSVGGFLALRRRFFA